MENQEEETPQTPAQAGFLGKMLIFTGILSFIVDLFSLLEIVRKVHLPHSINIPVPDLPKINITVGSSSIRTQEFTFILLVYIYLVIATSYAYLSKRSEYDVSKDDELLVRLAMSLHFFLLVLWLWILAFLVKAISSYLVFHFSLAWALSSILIIAMAPTLKGNLNDRKLNFILIGILFFIPAWIFIERIIFGLSWIESIASVVFLGLGLPIAYLLIVFFLVLITARFVTYFAKLLWY